MSDYSINLADRTKYVTALADVKQSWHIILSTVPGSIPLQPDFGSDLHSFIDKPINNVFSEMANIIIRDLERWEKRTKITKVTRIIENISTIRLLIYGIYTPTSDEIMTDILIIDPGNGGIGSMIIGETFIIT